MNCFKISLPNSVVKIIDNLERSGHEAYGVGGCIRDCLMGKEPQDWDICTSALPEEVMELFESFNLVKAGLKHGTVGVVMDGEIFEITTYRVDGEYEDCRRPKEVTFTPSLREDLARRDFTINAMAYNPRQGLIDYCGGIQDLKNRRLRCVGDPKKRFSEDALRIFRALRFASVLGFDIEKGTERGMFECRDRLNNIAKERINGEFSKLILGESCVKVLRENVSVIGTAIPELIDMVGFQQNTVHHSYDVWEHSLKALENIMNLDGSDDLILRLAMIFHDVGKPRCYVTDKLGAGHFYGHGEVGEDMVRDILNRLRYPKDTISAVAELVKYHDTPMPEKRAMKRWMSRLSQEQMERLIKIKYSDLMAQSEYLREEKLAKWRRGAELFREILEEQCCLSLKSLEINGRDLMYAGISEGREIGEILNKLLNMVINEEIENEKSELLKFVKQWKNL